MLKKLNRFLKYANTNCLQRRKEVWTLSNILFVGILTGTSSLENNLAISNTAEGAHRTWSNNSISTHPYRNSHKYPRGYVKKTHPASF